MAIDTPPAVETIVVRAARLPPSPADAAFAVVAISPQDLASTPRLDQVLETSPGASLFRPGSSAGANPTTQGISLRSIAPSAAGRALVTLDGVPQNDPFGGWVIWSSLPSETLGDIRLVRGAGAGPYGAGALTGVIALAETLANRSIGPAWTSPTATPRAPCRLPAETSPARPPGTLLRSSRAITPVRAPAP